MIYYSLTAWSKTDYLMIIYPVMELVISYLVIDGHQLFVNQLFGNLNL